jgi:feruloyl esterase
MPAAGGLPEYCEVTATVSPVAGSRIGVVYRLPAGWNGKLVGLGGGGFAGDVTLQTATPALQRAYAVAQTDMGHPSTEALDPKFALGPDGKLDKPAVTDFGHRATHLMTVVGKATVATYYGKPQSRAYFQGCSTGGRQGLMEAQRYPDDYDGIVAGAPVYNTLVYSTAVLRTQFFHARPESNLRPEQVTLIAKAVMKSCDKLDGVEDGILTDPRQCHWDPGELQCKDGEGPDCLTAAQVETVRTMYRGVTRSDGRLVAAPLLRGGEPDWLIRSVGTPQLPVGLNARLGAPFISYLVKQNPAYDLFKFDPAKDMAELDASFAAQNVVAQDPDISPFIKHGGKLILWHGFNDPGPSPLQTIKYYEAVVDTVGKKLSTAAKPEAMDQDVRLFLAPGVYHCRGGPGPDKFDGLTALDTWLEQSKPPERIIATKVDAKISRPLCPYPQLARYNGSGDTDDAASFTCAAAAQ